MSTFSTINQVEFWFHSSNLLSEQLGELSLIAKLKRSYDFHADADNVLAKARVKYAGYDVDLKPPEPAASRSKVQGNRVIAITKNVI